MDELLLLMLAGSTYRYGFGQDNKRLERIEEKRQKVRAKKAKAKNAKKKNKGGQHKKK